MDRREHAARAEFDAWLECRTEQGDPIPRLHWILCPVCEGNGTDVNPAIDGHGIAAERRMGA